MSISPWPQGDTSPSWKFLLTLDSGILDVSLLTPSSFSLILHNTSSNQEITGQGTFFGLQAASGNNPPSISYAQDPADVATIGENRAYIVITNGLGARETLSVGYINIEGR